MKLVTLALLLAALTPSNASEEKIEVVTTLGVLADLTSALGGDFVHVEALADPRQDPHFVEPRPTLMQKARQADLFVEIGLDLELWAEKVVSGSGNPRIQQGQPGRVIASAGVRALELPAVLSREWGDVHPYGNPHVWLDPLNVKTMAANIAAALGRVAPEHAAEFQANLERFEQRIDEALFGSDLVLEVGAKQLARQARLGRLQSYLEGAGLADRLGGWMKKAAPLRGRPIVTYHKTSAYLADRFGFEVPIEIEEKPGIPPSARHRDKVLELIRQRGVKTLFQEIYYERSAAEYLAGKGGARVVAEAIDVGAGASDYFALIDHILDDLVASETAP